jgi:hypothetical protein
MLPVLLLAVVSMAWAGRLSVLVPSSSITTYEAAEPGLGDYYLIRFDIPVTVTQENLEHAYLEFYVDATSREVDGYVDETPLLELYALVNEFDGQLASMTLAPPTIRTVRNVRVGNSRRVVVDVTEIVRAYIAEPTRNHGVLVGSLTGRRDGEFALKGGVIRSGVTASIQLFLR